ncbi:hypothetical protein [Pseudooctadecabacter jejudonensis]|uniref:Sulfotransferase family protein n=1 Tax=Pseudooctadecabacter jejudonensis TaxID=1391910 RepID=A0A1Y5TJS2_9RHOB|nr:hypothetical protein [Pseudooctadecabacter jejudonensis]SLN62050.1 hypothetical protein PSJ8397_03291 [Pseudooctadecabacter jejudonensis]
MAKSRESGIVTFHPCIGVAWPDSGQDLLVALLNRYAKLLSGPDSVVSFEATNALTQTARRTKDARYIVQSCDYVTSVLTLFQHAVASGTPDMPEAFRDTASVAFDGYLAFKRDWMTSDFARMDHVLHLYLHDLRDAPALSLSLAVRHLAPDHTPDQTMIEQTVSDIMGDDVKNASGLHDHDRDAQHHAFRHYDKNLFNAISRMTLRRSDVLECYDTVLGHPPLDKNIIHLQQFASREMLMDHLRQSEEYKSRFGDGTTPAITSSRQDKPRGPHVLIHLHIPKSGSTHLNAKLVQGQTASQTVTATGGIPNKKLRDMTADARANVRVIAGHSVYGLHDMVPHPCIYMCVLRKPEDRLFAFHQFLLTHQQHPAHGWATAHAETFGAFVQKVHENPSLLAEVDNGQTRRIAGMMNTNTLTQPVFRRAVKHLLADDMVFGLTDHFGAFAARLSDLGLISPTPQLRADDPIDRAALAEALAAFTSAETSALKKYTTWDQRLYTIAQSWLGL